MSQGTAPVKVAAGALHSSRAPGGKGPSKPGDTRTGGGVVSQGASCGDVLERLGTRLVLLLFSRIIQTLGVSYWETWSRRHAGTTRPVRRVGLVLAASGVRISILSGTPNRAPWVLRESMSDCYNDKAGSVAIKHRQVL